MAYTFPIGAAGGLSFGGPGTEGSSFLNSLLGGPGGPGGFACGPGGFTC